METQNQDYGRRFWLKRALFIPVIIVAGALLFGGAVMFLWNAILPSVTSVGTINFWQALGILLLAKILFGGFRGRWGGWGRHRRMYWQQKWMNMSEEERAKFREQWAMRCGRKTQQEQ